MCKQKEVMAEKIAERDVRLEIADYLEEWGIKRSWLAKKIGRSTTLISFILDCRADLTEDNLNKINQSLGTDFKK